MTTWDLRDTSCHLLICNGGSCMLQGAEEVTTAIREEIASHGADHRMHTTRTRCNGRCVDACVVIAYPDGVWYKNISPELGRALVRKHLSGETMEEHATYYYDGTFVATGNAIQGKPKPAD